METIFYEIKNSLLLEKQVQLLGDPSVKKTLFMSIFMSSAIFCSLFALSNGLDYFTLFLNWALYKAL